MNLKLKENLKSGYPFAVLFSLLCFFAFYLYFLVQISNSSGGKLYVESLCVFGIVFILSCVLTRFIPKQFSAVVSEKRYPIPLGIIILVVGVVSVAAIMSHYLLVSEVKTPPYAINYATIFNWRLLPLPLMIVWTVLCIGIVFYLTEKNININEGLVYFVYATVLLLSFMHNLYLNNYDVHHHAATYDSVYNVYYGVPYDKFTTGIYGHYGIFIGLILRLFNGDAVMMFYLHAMIAAAGTAMFLYIIHNVTDKNYIRVIAALAGIYVIGVLTAYVHWQSITLRNFAALLIVVYIVWMCKNQKYDKKYILFGYALSSFGIVWNLESGLSALVAFSSAIIILTLQKRIRNLYVYIFIMSICAVIFAIAFVNMYNLICGGKLIFKAFFFPYFENVYMRGWGGIKPVAGNQAWVYVLVGFLLLLLLSVYNTQIFQDKSEKMDAFAPVYIATALCGLGLFSYYAARGVYLNLDLTFYLACIQLTIFADKFGGQILDIFKERLSISSVICKMGGGISMAILAVLASQIVFTVPNLLAKSQSGLWDVRSFKGQAEMMGKALPDDVMLIGIGTNTLKLQLKRDTQYFYRNTDLRTSGTNEYCDKVIENAKKSKYVAFRFASPEDPVIYQRFLELAPEFKYVGKTNISGFEYKLYSRLEDFPNFPAAQYWK